MHFSRGMIHATLALSDVKKPNVDILPAIEHHNSVCLKDSDVPVKKGTLYCNSIYIYICSVCVNLLVLFLFV
jgi:hypothetical protein